MLALEYRFLDQRRRQFVVTHDRAGDIHHILDAFLDDDPGIVVKRHFDGLFQFLGGACLGDANGRPEAGRLHEYGPMQGSYAF